MKLAKKYSIFLIVLFIIILLGINSFFTPISKLLFRTGRIISPPINAIIKIDGIENRNIKIFKTSEIYDPNRPNLHNRKIKSLIIWFPLSSSRNKRNIFYINIERQIIGNVNSSSRDYDLFFKKYLFQSDSGQYVVSWDDKIKGINFNPKLIIKKFEVSFILPENFGKYKFKKMNIKFNKKINKLFAE